MNRLKDKLIEKLKTIDYKDIIPIVEKKSPPSFDELKILYNDNKIKIKTISKLYGWSNSNKISQLVDQYGFEKWHLDFEFKPESHERFITELKSSSVSEIARKYNVNRDRVAKYIKKHNLTIGYYNSLSKVTSEDLIRELENDFIFNIANKYSVSPYELKRKLTVDNIDIFDIKLNESVIKNKLIEFVDTNPTYE